jgi:hypothetical protein
VPHPEFHCPCSGQDIESQKPMSLKVVDSWRSQILTIITWSLLGLGSIATVVGAVAAFRNSEWGIILFDLVSFCLILGITLVPSRFFRFKASAIILLI